MEKNLEIGLLSEIYGGLLTEKQRDMIGQYYDDDLSLGEIADNCGITRQGVRDVIRRTEAALADYERVLGIARRYRAVSKIVEQLAGIAGALDGHVDEAGRAYLAQILDAVARLRDDA